MIALADRDMPDLLVAPVRLPDVDPPAPHALDVGRYEDEADYADQYAAHGWSL